MLQGPVCFLGKGRHAVLNQTYECGNAFFQTVSVPVAMDTGGYRLSCTGEYTFVHYFNFSIKLNILYENSWIPASCSVSCFAHEITLELFWYHLREPLPHSPGSQFMVGCGRTWVSSRQMKMLWAAVVPLCWVFSVLLLAWDMNSSTCSWLP